MSDDAVLDSAAKLRDRLLSVAKEIRFRRDGNRKMHEMDAGSCEQAAAMLQKLGTEVTRLRLGIGHYRYGMMERHRLIAMTENWNDDPREGLTPQ